MKEWTTPDCRNTPSTTNQEEEETVDEPGNDGNASMPEEFKRHNSWMKMMIKIRNNSTNWVIRNVKKRIVYDKAVSVGPALQDGRSKKFGSICGLENSFFFSWHSRRDLSLTQPSVRCERVQCSSGMRRLECEASHSP